MRKVECFEEDFPPSYCSTSNDQYHPSLQSTSSSMPYGISTTEMLLTNLNRSQWSTTAEFIEHSREPPFAFSGVKKEQADDPLSMNLIPLVNEGETQAQLINHQQHRPTRDSLGGRNKKLHDLDRAQILKNFSLGLYSSKIMKNEEFSMLRDDKGQKVAIRCLACSAIFSPCVGGHLNYHRRNACSGTQRSQDHIKETMPKVPAPLRPSIPTPTTQTPTPQAQILKSAAEMCALDGISPSILQAKGFRQFLQCLADQLTYQTAGCSRSVSNLLPHPSLVWKHVRRKVDNKRAGLGKKLREQLKTCGLAVSLELEAGSCTQTAHYIADDWTFQSVPLRDFKAKDSQNLVVQVKTSLNGEGLTDLNGVSVVLPEDNSVNSGLTTMRCAMNWMDWLVRTAINPTDSEISALNTLLEQLKSVFEFLREFPLLSDDLLVKIADLTEDLRWFRQIKLVAALRQLNDQEKAQICNLLESEPAFPNKLQTTKQTEIRCWFEGLCQQQECLYEVLQLFQPVLHAAQTLNNSKVPTLHKVLPLLQSIKQNFQEVQRKPECSPTVKALANATLEVLRQESHQLVTDQHYFALILDPTQKNKIREYIQSKEERDQLTQKFKSAVLTAHKQHKQDSATETSNCDSVNLSDSYFDVDVALSVGNTDADIEKEVISYLCTPTLPVAGEEQMALLQFWQQSLQQFPSCSRVARKILAIPACASTMESASRRLNGGKQISVENLSDLSIYRAC